MRGVRGGKLVLGKVIVAVEDVDGGDLHVGEAHAAVGTFLLEDPAHVLLGLRGGRLLGRHFLMEVVQLPLLGLEELRDSGGSRMGDSEESGGRERV